MITWLRNLIYGKKKEEQVVTTPVVAPVVVEPVVEPQITDAVTVTEPVKKIKKPRKPYTKKVKK
jgi:hypothetical protein